MIPFAYETSINPDTLCRPWSIACKLHLNNPDFNSIEFDGVKNQAALAVNYQLRKLK